MLKNIPKEVLDILEKLEKANFEGFLVGGCVRDLLLKRKVSDWDITTNAKPEEIQKLFPDSFYENEFGTVGVKTDSKEFPVVEVTTYRKEEAYTDKRHPDKIEFTSSLKEDLARRDFTVNAIAARIENQELRITDSFDGQEDIKNKLIRAVGKSEERFNEDALRLMRAVRFAAQLSAKGGPASSWGIEDKTQKALKKEAKLLQAISKERIRDELIKIIESDGAEQGIRLLQELGLLKYVISELEEGVGVAQNKHHIYEVFEHNVRSLGYAVKYSYNTAVRLAALLHDVAKPHTKEGEGESATFYGHEVVGARLTAKILDRLRFPKKLARKVITLVRYHLFYYDVGEVTEKAVRRLLRKVGPENIDELLEVRISERKGSGVPKAEPYRLRHLRYMLDKVSRDPLTVGMLKVSGEDVMKELDLKPSPRVGYILNALLEEVLDDPKKNTKKNLVLGIKELGKLSDKELKKLAEAGKGKLKGKEEEADKQLKGKHYVK